MAIDHRELDDNDLAVIEKMLPKEFGPVRYLLAFNDEKWEFLCTRKGISVEDDEKEDEEWKRVNKSLALKRNEALEQGLKYDYMNIRVGTTQDQDTVTVTLENTECRHRPVGGRCRGRRMRYPRP